MEEIANGASTHAAKRARLQHHQESISAMSMGSRESILSDTTSGFSNFSAAPCHASSSAENHFGAPAFGAPFSLLNALQQEEAHKKRAATNITSQPPTPQGVVRACVVRRSADKPAA